MPPDLQGPIVLGFPTFDQSPLQGCARHFLCLSFLFHSLGESVLFIFVVVSREIT